MFSSLVAGLVTSLVALFDFSGLPNALIFGVAFNLVVILGQYLTRNETYNARAPSQLAGAIATAPGGTSTSFTTSESDTVPASRGV